MFDNNKLTKLLGIKYPIIQGGMAGVSESTLVAAVSNAGGLGVIGSGFAPPAWLEEEIKKQRHGRISRSGSIFCCKIPGRRT